jgi:hypothetical protein
VASSEYERLAAEYQSLSDEFTEINKEYNRALRTDTLTDDLELRFLKAERALHAAYRDQQNAKIEENV